MSTPLSTIVRKILPQVINLSNKVLIKDEVEMLKFGLSFTLTAKHKTSELENYIYDIIRKITKSNKLLKMHLHLLQNLMKTKN